MIARGGATFRVWGGSRCADWRSVVILGRGRGELIMFTCWGCAKSAKVMSRGI